MTDVNALAFALGLDSIQDDGPGIVRGPYTWTDKDVQQALRWACLDDVVWSLDLAQQTPGKEEL